LKKPFRNPETIELCRAAGIPAIFDGKNCLSSHMARISDSGIDYIGVGVESLKKTPKSI